MVAIFTEKVMAEEGAERLKTWRCSVSRGFSSLSPQNRKLMYRFGESVLNAGWWWEKDSNLRSL